MQTNYLFTSNIAMMNYNKLVESCFFQPTHVGVLDCEQPGNLRIRQGEPSQGAYFDLYVSCEKSGDISKACFKAYGNPYIIAGLEWLCRQLQGTNINTHPKLNYHVIVEKLEIPRPYYPNAVLIESGYCALVTEMKKRVKGD
jgi:nitrogen fixation NifU-like protein